MTETEGAAAKLPRVVVHTDGACSGNPGPGGWAAILTYGEHEKELKGGEAHTTNNRMELMGAIAAPRANSGSASRSASESGRVLMYEVRRLRPLVTL